MESLDTLIERLDVLRRARRADAPTTVGLLERIVDHPDAAGHPDFPGMLAELAEWQANQRDYDAAVVAMTRAIGAGVQMIPDPRCDLADYHLRAGRPDIAADLFADVRAVTPDDVWLYNAAALAYTSVGDDDTALAWLNDGLELALRGVDAEDLVAQLADLRAECRRRRGLDPADDVDRQAGAFLAARRAALSAKPPLRVADDRHGLIEHAEVATPGRPIAAAIAVFARGHLSRALGRWPDLRDDWEGVDEDAYLRAMDARAAGLRRSGVAVRAVAVMEIETYESWAREYHLDPGTAGTRSRYAADQLRLGLATPWPPGRNDPCWCGTGRKYKRCCASG